MMAPDDTLLKDRSASGKPSARTPKHDEVVTTLRAMIVEGDLSPGERLPEQTLCDQLGISRTPLREAMRVLASEGLVSLTPNRGATVSEITANDVDEMFPVMGTLEALAGELACQHIDDDGIAEVKALHYQMVLHYRRRELSDYFRCNRAIHEKILEAAKNPTLEAMHASLEGRIRRARYLANMSDKRWKQAVAEHEEILEAVETRNGKKLSQILKRHLENKCATVKEALAEAD